MPNPPTCSESDQTNQRAASRFERRREEILNAAGGLFNRHGLRDATLAVIAADIGLNLKSLRHYFARREDLVAAAFMRSIALHEELVRDASGERDVQGRVRRFIRGYFDLQARIRRRECPEFVHFGDIRALAEPHAATVSAAYSGMFRAIRTLFRGDEAGWSRARLNAATHMLLSQLLWSVVWTNTILVEDYPRFAEHLSDILLHGVAAATPDASLFSGHAEVLVATSDRLSRESFLHVATLLINRLGYRGASVDRISAELNVTKGAFYHYNETRDGLVVACFERSFALIRDAQDAAASRQPPPRPWSADRCSITEPCCAPRRSPRSPRTCAGASRHRCRG